MRHVNKLGEARSRYSKYKDLEVWFVWCDADTERILLWFYLSNEGTVVKDGVREIMGICEVNCTYSGPVSRADKKYPQL